MALCLMAMLLPVAGAASDWCEDDPAITIPMSRVWGPGQDVVVHVTNYANGDHLADLRSMYDPTTGLVRPSYIAVDDVRVSPRGDAADVEIHVLIPNLKSSAPDFRVRSVVSQSVAVAGSNTTQPVGVLATAQGRSNQVMRLHFRLTKAQA
jgi:hypothetical protein